MNKNQEEIIGAGSDGLCQLLQYLKTEGGERPFSQPGLHSQS